MNIITGINNNKIYNELKENKNININYKDIQYKEAILEILEKNKNIQHIIIREDIKGEISIVELTNKIKEINNKINIVIILIKKEEIKEIYYKNNNIKYLYLEKLNYKNIIEILNIKKENKILGIIGTSGTGKTITTLIISELLLIKNKKILIISDEKKNNTIAKTYLYKNNYENENENDKKQNLKEEKNNKNEEIKILELKNNLFLLNNFEKKTNINNYIKEINNIKNNYDYVFIIITNIFYYKIYKKLINKIILIINSNIYEFNKSEKIIKKLIKENIPVKILLNNYNENSISEILIKNILNNNFKILEKINYNKNYNLIINNNINIKFLDNKTKNKFEKIINKF